MAVERRRHPRDHDVPSECAAGSSPKPRGATSADSLRSTLGGGSRRLLAPCLPGDLGHPHSPPASIAVLERSSRKTSCPVAHLAPPAPEFPIAWRHTSSFNHGCARSKLGDEQEQGHRADRHRRRASRRPTIENRCVLGRSADADHATVGRYARRHVAVSAEDTGVRPVRNPGNGDGKGPAAKPRKVARGPSQKTGLARREGSSRKAAPDGRAGGVLPVR